ncbi:MAG: pyridoxamine 5'-phosphate oxidase family protein [Chitinispirillaceae bacterium]|nr:pyridoxamine 5'-phosphate oxidase family protein [Chitinispirillaceae bacterium]
MRRSEKAVTKADELYRIIDSCDFCRIGMINETFPYIVPVCFVRMDDAIFFHCAREGMKNDLVRLNPNVCFEMECDVSIVPSENPCRWGVRYKSIIGTGRASFVEDPAEKERVLAALMRKYGGTNDSFFFEQASIDATSIVRIAIISLTGKQS